MKITHNNILNRFEEGVSNRNIYNYWAQVNDSLINFEKKANMRTFTKLFEPYAEADRLWNHFTQNCNYKFQQFLTYLTQEQKNELIVNAHENKTYLYT